MKYIDRFKSTTTTIFLVIACFTSIILLLLYVFMSFHTNKTFLEFKKQYYTERTYHLSYILRTNMQGILYGTENQKILNDLSKEYLTSFEIVSKDDKQVLYKNGIDHDGYVHSYPIEVPIVSDGAVLGYLRAYYDLEQQKSAPEITGFQKRLAGQQNRLFGICLLIALIGSFILAKRFSKPMKEMSVSARSILKGNRESFVPRKGTTEVKQLVDSINSLLVEFNNLENWRKQMMEDLTHELRTPLTSVLTRMEAIIDGVYPTTEKNLQDIYDEVERFSRLVINVQKLSEAEGARFKLNIKKANVTSLIKGVYEGFLYLAQQKDIQLDFQHPNRPCSAYIDPDRIIQVVTNIVSNAIKYTPSGGKVLIGIESYDTEIIIYCQDNGIGIAEEDIHLVFNRFYRTDLVRSQEGGGSGIGLSISKALIHAHGGDIGVESELDGGSKFWVRIPVESEG